MCCTRQSIVDKLAEVKQNGRILPQDQREKASSQRKFSSLCTFDETKMAMRCNDATREKYIQIESDWRNCFGARKCAVFVSGPLIVWTLTVKKLGAKIKEINTQIANGKENVRS